MIITNILTLVIGWLHLLATVVWIGAMFVLLFVILPAAKEALGSNSTFKKMIKSVGKRMTFWVNVSIIVLIITGIVFSAISERTSTGTSLILKHVLVSAMIVIHLSRNKIIAPKLEKIALEDPSNQLLIKLKKLQIDLVWVNLFLGTVVLLLSFML